METYVCSVTGKEFRSNDPFIYEDKIFSPSARNRYFARCSECGEWHLKEAFWFGYLEGLLDKKYLCKKCRGLYTACPICGTLVKKDILIEIWDHRLVCPTCIRDRFFICSDCGMYHRNSDRYRDRLTGQVRCPYCHKKVWATCHSCGEEVQKIPENLCSNGLYYCIDCNPDRQPIKHHLYVPKDLIFYGEDKVFYGHEVEVVVRENTLATPKAAQKVLDMFKGMVYCKRDGSLPEHGFEIVTYPMSYAYTMQNNIFLTFNDIDFLRSFRHPQCGHHIHVSRTAFKNDHHLAKTIVFFAQNDYFIEFIAQRPHGDYCKLELTGAALEEKLRSQGRGHEDRSRYSAVNLTNRNTVEFRVFKGNISPERIIKNLQFVKCVIEFADLSDMHDLTETKFLEYIKATNYEYLKEFCKTYKKNADL